MTEEEDPEGLEDLLAFIRDARGFDFTGNKRASLGRRIRKRVQDVGLERLSDYRDLLETNSDEFNALFNTILINVTGFFRDTATWQFLQQEILPDLLARARSGEELRLWSAGCSSGEEAYTLAIALAELMGVSDFVDRVKIYGTDVDEDALHQARAGVYPPAALENLPDGTREKYFEPSGSGFAFRPDLRRRVVFGRHDIARDAPISRLHLLACRNTLMYFNAETQARIIDRFHFALREGGYLVLGKAEMLLSDAARFETIAMRHRVFQRLPGGVQAPEPAIRFEPPPTFGRSAPRRRELRDLAIDVDPNGLIALDTDGTVVLINSQARASFTLSESDVGRPFRDLEISYRPTELRSLIERAHADLNPLRVHAVEYRRGLEESGYYDILIQPLTDSTQQVRGTALVFVDSTRTTHLQHELRRNREDLEHAYEELQSTNEELETTNEELQSSIEELETTNEELQSTNEELETTNEELQSGNEELETMNEELRIRSTELDDLRSFSESILTSVASAMVVLDAELVVRAWNPGAQELWGLRQDEAEGRPFFGLRFGLPVTELRNAVQDCLRTGTRPADPLEIRAVNRLGAGIVCTVRLSPLYGRPDEGVVMLIEQTGRSEA